MPACSSGQERAAAGSGLATTATTTTATASATRPLADALLRPQHLSAAASASAGPNTTALPSTKNPLQSGAAWTPDPLSYALAGVPSAPRPLPLTLLSAYEMPAMAAALIPYQKPIMVSAPPVQDTLGNLLADLCSQAQGIKVREDRDNALRDYVESEARDFTGEAFTRFMSDVYDRIYRLINSHDRAEKLGGVLAIDELIDIKLGEEANKITRFANYLHDVFQPSCDVGTMTAASRALGHLARTGAALAADVVELEIKRALDWLRSPDRSEMKLFAAVVILKELAENAPTVFNVHVSPFVESIWFALRDEKLLVREAAVSALRACLCIIEKRETRHRVQWYYRMFEQTQDGLTRNLSTESIHGSLLTIGELLRYTGEFMLARYKEVVETVLKYRDHREKLIRRSVTALIPRLAKFSPDRFVMSYQQVCMAHLVNVMKSSNERVHGFEAVGELAGAVGPRLEPHLPVIVERIRESISVKRGKPFCHEALACLGCLAAGVGTPVEPYVCELMDAMFSGGLNTTLVAALTQITNSLPQLLPPIQERLLNIISRILAHRPFFAPAVSTTNGLASPSGSYMNSPNSSIEMPSTPLVQLALRTLGSFNFQTHAQALLEFVREVVVQYWDDTEACIRKEAALTCCKLLENRVHYSKPPAGEFDGLVSTTETGTRRRHLLVEEVLDRLLVVAVADADPGVRKAVLAALRPGVGFDEHLAQADALRAFFITLNDEVFEVRKLAIALVGRLADRNPAYVLPALRRHLLQLLTYLEQSPDSKQKEESAVLLGCLVRSCKRLVLPYVAPIIKVLLSKLEENSHGSGGPSSGLTVAVISAIGDLSQVGGSTMLTYVSDLLPILIEALHDSVNVAKCDACVSTLGKLVESTGYVVQPYMSYPQLLGLLLRLLNGELPWSTRREVIKVLGIIGALDPHVHKRNEHSLQSSMTGVVDTLQSVSTPAATVDHNVDDMQADLLPPSGMATTSDEYYPTVAIGVLLRHLRDDSLVSHHLMVVRSLMYIFKALGLGCVPYLPKVMPVLFHVMRHCDDTLRDFMFQQLALLHIRPYLRQVLQLVLEYWNNKMLLLRILKLLEELSHALNEEFRGHLTELLLRCVSVISEAERSGDYSTVPHILKAFEAFGGNVDEHLHLLLPAYVRLFKPGVTSAPLEVRRIAIQSLAKLLQRMQLTGYASAVIHPLARVVDGPNDELREDAINAICSVAIALGNDFTIFVPMIRKLLEKHRIRHQRFSAIASRLLKHEPPVPVDAYGEDAFQLAVHDRASAASPDAGQVQLTVNADHLKKAWESSQRVIKEDWAEWIRHFSIELLKESPSPALRACYALAQLQPSVARELFAAAFVSCWSELYESYQDQLVRSLEAAFASPNIPPEIVATLLNLAEFMEHDEKPLPVDIRTLGLLAEKCHAFAKALHYKEMQFHTSPGQCIEALISINNQLQQPEAAVGILVYAQKHLNAELKESWYEKLQRWDDALEAYERKKASATTPAMALQADLGRIRCLAALAEWEELSKLCKDTWPKAEGAAQLTMAPMAANAAWQMGEWEEMEKYTSALGISGTVGTVGSLSNKASIQGAGAAFSNRSDGAFYRAVLCVRKGEFPQAQAHVERARELIATELAALVGESYERAYGDMVRVQQLAEIEEVMHYCQLKPEEADEKHRMQRMWSDRIRGAQRNVEVWQAVLAVRSLILPSAEDAQTWLKFASLCRKSGRVRQSHRTLVRLLQADQARMAPNGEAVGNGYIPGFGMPNVFLAYLKHMWAVGDEGKRRDAFRHLQSFAVELNNRVREGENMDSAFMSKVYLKLGTWRWALCEELNDAAIQDVLSSLHEAKEAGRAWAKAWHHWALFNAAAMEHYYRTAPQLASRYVAPAITGFFSSIALGTAQDSPQRRDGSLQDILRLLTLWFNHGSTEEVQAALREGFDHVSIDTWLVVIPQIIARIHSNSPSVRSLIHLLLVRIGHYHPQALMYPLLVACKSQSPGRRAAAMSVIENLQQRSAPLVEQAQLVSQELIRIAILWHEMWHEALEEASRLYFGEHNVQGMLAVLEPLHAMMEKQGPETLKEINFEANEWCQKFKRSGKEAELNQAWDLYYHVFKRINKQLPSLTTLELQFVSPHLAAAQNLELAVPGTYRAGAPVVTIAGFAPTLVVITSKQRPRKFTTHGSDGGEYVFLLKGHEDLRQDERVMQLFGLVNTLLANHRDTAERDLSIVRYAVVPLSPNSGLIGWVPNCDTLHYLIREYREARNITLNIEHRMMVSMAPDYDHLTLMAKVEVFEHALESTAGQDIHKVLWLKSRSSEVWLSRRTNYTRSLAVMSMVGYILGLGDRHPSNLMLDRYSGKILHIDFGDCFEASMNREKFPEKVPFRLTRMLIKAMEVSGIEGNFRKTCEATMHVLRANKDSVMAMLEAFVHDPLINWRLMNTNEPIADPVTGALTSTRHQHPTPVMVDGRLEAGEGQSPPRRGVREKELLQAVGQLGDANEVLNERAVAVMKRMSHKLTGRDFPSAHLGGSTYLYGGLVSGSSPGTPTAGDRAEGPRMSVEEQVQKLVLQSTSHENLCQSYIGYSVGVSFPLGTPVC
eukprot:jgi/Chlat1/8814/Chrsp90S08148